MAIPQYDKMYCEVLDILSDGKPHKLSAIRDSLADIFQVTEEERKELLPSGKQAVFNNRSNWACVYLKKAGLIENAVRGIYQITALGQKIHLQNVREIDNAYLMQFESFRMFLKGTEEPDQQRAKKITGKETDNQSELIESELSGRSPQDILDDAYSKINDTLVDEVLSEVLKQTPRFFEHLVVKLMTAIGYGGSLEGAGIVTQASVDGGIDGIIREDKLGFNKIYIQAKRWDRNNTVGAPEIQRFFGALAAKHAKKGLFITTSKFSEKAKEFADQQQIVLVDGKALAKLMIEYNVGVSIEATYYIKKIDSDFFDDDLN